MKKHLQGGSIVFFFFYISFSLDYLKITCLNVHVTTPTMQRKINPLQGGEFNDTMTNSIFFIQV